MQLLASGSITFIAVATEYWQLGFWLVVYNCVAEILLVTASTQLGMRLKQLFFDPANDNDGVLSTPSEQARYNLGDREGLHVGTICMYIWLCLPFPNHLFFLDGLYSGDAFLDAA